jgi:hypothetical protein
MSNVQAVEMEALHSFHASHAQPSILVAGDSFTINETEAKQLGERGLAKPKSGAVARKRK